MPIDARIPLMARPFRLSEALELGRGDKREREGFEMAKQDREREIERQRQADEQAKAEAQQKADEEARRKNLESIAVGAVEIKPLLDNIETVPAAVNRLRRRIQEIEARDGDASDSKELLEMIEQGRVNEARAILDSTIGAGEAQGILPGKTTQASARNVSSVPGVQGGRQGVFVVTRNPDGALSSQFVPAPGDFTATNRQGETPAAQAGREIETAGGTTRVRAEETRIQNIITQGQEVADTAPVLRRSLALLDVVETGGVLNEAQLKLAQSLGVETADQGELSANLGKAVLGQLRETFGAQFTEQEGQRLENIEAGFGKNNETNKRLLQQALAIVEAKARRAIKLARERDDEATAQIIEEALNMSIQPETEQQPRRVRYDAQGNRIGN